MRVRLPLGPDRALLYVDPGCPHCKAEVEAWRDLVRRGGARGRLSAVVSSGSAEDARARLPGLDALSWYLDPDGSVARALGVTAVPFIAVTGAGGSVVSVRMGRSSPAELLRTLASMHEPASRRAR